MYMYMYMYMWLHACMLSVYHYYNIIASAHVHACSRCMAWHAYIHTLSRRDDSKSLTIINNWSVIYLNMLVYAPDYMYMHYVFIQ